LLDKLALKALRRELTPIKVVFDKGNANERWLEKGYCTYYSQKPDTRLKTSPVFEDDQDLIPLRAADAYAWLLGRKYNEQEELEQLRIIHDPLLQFERQEAVLTAERAKQLLRMIKSADDDKKDNAS
jgi:hypothetical protein